MLIWCFSSQTYRKKTFVFQNNAKQSKLTALITITKTCSRHVLFLAQNVKNVRKFCMCICHLPLSCIVCTCSVKLWQIFKFGNFNKFFYLTRSRKKIAKLTTFRGMKISKMGEGFLFEWLWCFSEIICSKVFFKNVKEFHKVPQKKRNKSDKDKSW